MKPQRGDVVLVLFPNSDLRTFKRRPALALQRDDLNNGLSQIIVAMIGSSMFIVGRKLLARREATLEISRGQRPRFGHRKDAS